MGAPHLFQVSDLVELTESMKQKHPEAGWIPLRPLTWPGIALCRRLKVAWGVFTGKYDAVFWEPTLKQCWKPEDNSDLNALLTQAVEAAGTHTHNQTRLVSAIPKTIDLSDQFGPVQDQGEIASSTSCALTAAIADQSAVNAGLVPFMYWNDRLFDEHKKERK